MGVPGFLGSQHVSAKFILKHYGLDPDKDMVYRIVDTGTRIAAMSSGAIDSSMMDYGEAFRAKKAGLKFLVNAADLHGLLAGGLAVNIKKLKEQPDQVRRMLKAMTQALKYIQDNPEGTQQVMMSWLKFDREMAADIYQMAKNNYTKNGMVEESNVKFPRDGDVGGGRHQRGQRLSADGFFSASASSQVNSSRKMGTKNHLLGVGFSYRLFPRCCSV